MLLASSKALPIPIEIILDLCVAIWWTRNAVVHRGVKKENATGNIVSLFFRKTRRMMHEMKWESMSPSSSVAISGNMPMLYPMNTVSNLHDAGNGDGENRLQKLWKAIFGVEKSFPIGISDDEIEAIIQNEVDELLIAEPHLRILDDDAVRRINTSEAEVSRDGTEEISSERVSDRSESEWSEEEEGTRNSGVKRVRARVLGDIPIERTGKRVRVEKVTILPIPDRRTNDGSMGYDQQLGHQNGIDGGSSHLQRLNAALTRMAKEYKPLSGSNTVIQRSDSEFRRQKSASALLALHNALRTQALSKDAVVSETDEALIVPPYNDGNTSELYDPHAALIVYQSRTLTRQPLFFLPSSRENLELLQLNFEIKATTTRSTDAQNNVFDVFPDVDPPQIESLELNLDDSILPHVQLPPQSIVRNN